MNFKLGRIVFFTCVVSCQQSAPGIKKVQVDAMTYAKGIISDPAKHIDTLTTREKLILQRICAENEFVMMSKKAQKLYSQHGTKVIARTVFYDSSALNKDGYLDLNVVFNYSGTYIPVGTNGVKEQTGL